MLVIQISYLFLLFWHKIRCIVLNKKEKPLVKKANHTISIYGKCMTSFFFDCDDKKTFVFFFQPQIDFRTRTNIF